MELYAYLDFDTHPASRANGAFYVIEIKDENGNVVPNLVPINRLYFSMMKLNEDVNMAFGMPTQIIEVTEQD